MLAGLVTLLFFWSYARRAGKDRVPSRWGNFVEFIILFIRDQMTRPFLGEHGDKYVPVITSFFVFILFCNLLGLVPLFDYLGHGGNTATGNLFITGALAPVVGSAVARRRPNAIGWAVAWNLFGIADLIAAPAAAILSGAQIIGLYPLSLVPLFLGPPLGILTHVYSLRNLALLSSTASVNVSDASLTAGSGAVTSRLRTT